MRILVANPIQILFPPMAKEFVAFKKRDQFYPNVLPFPWHLT